jgi:transcriptional regulator with XRE-family HTH domain
MIPSMLHPVLTTSAGRLTLDSSIQALDGQIAMAIAIARRMRPPMKVFADEVRREMGLTSLSRRAVYAWERGEARVPAAALLAAANVADRSIDELLFMVRELERLGLQPGE